MAGTDAPKFWNAGTLKSRGWTEELMRQLLPKPGYRHANGRSVRFWNRQQVLEAELKPEFLRGKAAAQPPRAEREAPERRQRATEARGGAAAFLQEAWETGEKPETADGRVAALATKYHEGILRRIPAASWARVRGGKAASYVEQFLLLEQGKGLRQKGTLTHFVTGAVWICRNADTPLARRLKERYATALTRLAEAELAAFLEAQPEANADALLVMDDFPSEELLTNGLGYVYSVYYVPRAIRTSLETLVALNPKDEYPKARAMTRRFILHIGGTNTGKTYAGFQRLRQAGTGVYLAPLRLLALEAQEVLLDYGVNCSLTTGEEEDVREGDTHVAATAEKLNLGAYYDVAVIDECQMIADPERGYAWSRAILGVLAPEVHLCAAPEAKDLLIRIIRSCGDEYEVVTHLRKTPLMAMKRTIDYSDVEPGDALITFSKVGVLRVAEDLRARGKEPAIIYGALPYATRRQQVEGFLSGDMQYVVSTDAIGMGLNLPIRRIIFMESEKFDGKERRPLKPQEVQQIAGRAGRFGMYDRGWVGAMEDLSYIREMLRTVVPPLQEAVVGFSDLVLMVDYDLLEVLTVWNRMETVAPYVKLDITRYITLITGIREQGFRLSREEELRAANIPFDETDDELKQLFYDFLRRWLNGQPVEQPELPPAGEAPYTLPQLEQHCRKLDLYFSFCKAFGLPVDVDRLRDERDYTADSINHILLHNLKNNIRFCAKCGAPLPLNYRARICSACFRKLNREKHRHERY